jgi:MarR family transcriptional regulator, transcriptional regulator for hemolysin
VRRADSPAVLAAARRPEPAQDGSAAEEPVGLLIAAARSRLKQAVLPRAAAHRLTAQQFWFLVALEELPGISQAELAERVRSDAPTTSRVVAGLARRRLVRKEPDPSDRRQSRLSLTLAGRKLAGELSRIARAIRAAVTEGMTEADQEALRGGLRRVIANLERLSSR